MSVHARSYQVTEFPGQCHHTQYLVIQYHPYRCDPAVRTGTTCTAMSTSLSLPGPLHITYHVRYTYHVSTTAQRCITSIVLT